MIYEFHLTAPRGAEDLLGAELIALGVDKPKVRKGGVSFRGRLELGYRACLWSRVASRVLVEIAAFSAVDADTLYEGSQAVDWTAHMREGASFAIAASGTPAPASGIDNTHFAALRVKDGLVDQLRERWGRRPNVDLDAPDLRLRLHLNGGRAHLSVDMAGEGLHRRGYRVAAGPAPLRENLAAAVLLRSGWGLGDAADPRALLDPMCGSATLLIEGAAIAGDIAPGLSRTRWGFEGWAVHGEAEAEAWTAMLDDARTRRERGRAILERTPLIGYDTEPDSVRAALACIEQAEMRGLIHVERRALADAQPPKGAEGGLLVCNPPWGLRLGNRRELESLYAAIGSQLRLHFKGWQAAVLTGDPGLGRHLGIRATKRNRLHDGPIECQILRLDVPAEGSEAEAAAQVAAERRDEPRPRSEGARSFANRLIKNKKQLRKWLGREGVTCFRLYDADIPEYNFVVDLYQAVARDGSAGPLHAHVQEYAPPDTVDEHHARRRRGEALAVIREDLDLPRERVHLKQRERQRGSAQYEKLCEESPDFVVAEGPAKLWVNLDIYLDTGLFLDHRPLRTWLSDPAGPAAGKRVLNLFSYSGAVTVHAALGGAKHTTSVDLSRTYLEWTGRNLALNGFNSGGDLGESPSAGSSRSSSRSGSRRAPHQLVRDDILEWVLHQGSLRWDLIICDPPSFSNSKRMRGAFDVERDHVDLIRSCVALLSLGGLLVFSTNKRRFKLDRDGLEGLSIEVHADSVPRDYVRRTKAHQAWLIRRD